MGAQPPTHHPPTAITPAASLRQLIDSLNREQRRNQELLASLGFALRSFTNLSRFLELVPLLTARLVEAEGAILLTLRSDGSLWREQLHGSASGRCSELLRVLAGLQDKDLDHQAGDELMASRLDQLVRRQLGDVQLFGTSVVAKNRQRGRLYVFSGDPQYSWSEVRRRHVQLVADQTAVAIENELLLEQMRQHQQLDQQLSIGGEIQAQLLPDRCPVIDGVELAARCRPAFQVGGDYYDFIPTKPQLTGKRREQGRWALVMGDVMGKGIPAGLLMTLLRGMLRAEVLTGLPPDRILHDLNQ
jgi:sigma-B regulation protein RsbU (phosphoserine phosphatase)